MERRFTRRDFGLILGAAATSSALHIPLSVKAAEGKTIEARFGDETTTAIAEWMVGGKPLRTDLMLSTLRQNVRQLIEVEARIYNVSSRLPIEQIQSSDLVSPILSETQEAELASLPALDQAGLCALYQTILSRHTLDQNNPEYTYAVRNNVERMTPGYYGRAERYQPKLAEFFAHFQREMGSPRLRLTADITPPVQKRLLHGEEFWSAECQFDPVENTIYVDAGHGAVSAFSVLIINEMKHDEIRMQHRPELLNTRVGQLFLKLRDADTRFKPV